MHADFSGPKVKQALEIKAQEREDALFECVLTHPLRRITWLHKGNILEDGDKYSICVSEHKLIHRLLIRDCKQLDKGIYSAVAGMKSCSAWLVVEAEGGPTSAGKRKPRKTTVAAGVRADLEKVAKEQQLKNQKEMEKILAAVKARHEAGQLEGERTLTSSKRDGETTAVTGPGKNLEAVGNNLDTAKTSVPTEPVGSKEKTTITNSKGDGTVSTLDVSGCVTKTAVQVTVDDPMKKKYAMSSQADFDKVADANEGEYSEKNEDFSRYKRHGQETKHRITEFNNKSIHIDQIQMFTTSQNEVTLSGEKDSEAVRHSEHTIKAQRTHHTTGKKQQGSTVCSAWKCSASTCKVFCHFSNPGVQFICGLSGVNAMVEETAELTCKLSSENCEGAWFRDGKKILPDDNFTITKDGAIHKLVIIKCKEEHSGKYRFEADDRKTEAIINVQDPPRFDPEDLSSFTEPVTVKAGQSAIFKMHFLGHEPIKSQWYREGEELQDDNNTKIETSAGQSLLLLTRCQRKNTGAIKIKLKNKHGYTEAISHLIVLGEEKPEIQDEAKGYFVKIQQADCIEWSCCNSTAIITTSFTVKGLKSMDMYWVRVIAANDGGKGAPEELANYVLAMPSPVRPKFTSPKMKSFMVVRAGNTVRITINFEASPWPDIIWLKDNVPVTKRVTISNSDSSSQLLIPSSERLDSGIYSILVKNLAGQETFSTEVRVTDDPKPPGPVELVENVPGTVTVMWEPSPDEKWDDRLHYTVSKLDSTKCTWTTVADRLFNNKFTVCNIMHGRECHFRVYAKNDMGISAPSESPTWGIKKNKERFMVSIPTRQDCDLRCAPTFIVPLKLHTAPKGYECCMSCAVKGNPKPRITWHRNHISLNTSTNYYISNTCGVCSMLILHVGPKDTGQYTITAESVLGQAECSTVLSVTDVECTTEAPTSLTQHYSCVSLQQYISESLESRLNALEESHVLAQKQVGMALATAEQLKTSDLPAQSFTVKGLKSMDMYWVRVIAANDGGKGAPEELANYVLAMPSPVRPKFTSPKMKSFMVVRAGNTVRITINFEASPWPDIIWLKDNVPVTKRVTISNSDSSSQLLIPSSERLDSGIYSILVKNLAGQETFSTEVRVTDYPKPPGLVELVENVPGTVTVMWEPSPDEKWDDRLHYTVSKLDSTKCTWTTVADRLFNNKFTVCNIMHGRECHFRVYAKNDMGISAPSESPTWGIKKNKERFMVSIPTRQDCDLRCAPTFIVPLKLHTAPKGYECCMSCAVKGNPKPRITWHRNHISLNTSTNYYISNTCGVCSMLILHVGPKDTGQYTITAENVLGQAECSTVLSITE
uniref:immunoglobulin-like and fibronectin type III domain-containing protein 1 n=1 Tax=Monopterus albus TaxID=43700 RepID=UPI0009B3A82E|nr:immunoglobulin-like and fibronectin type III domain-containing protein 1 [Monopterus albus]